MPSRRALLSMALWPLAAAADDALIEAAERGDLATLRRRLDAGAPINARDSRGRNAVLAATQGGQTDAARLLIARGADVRLADRQGVTALAHAEQRGQRAIVALLREAAARRR